MEICAENYTIDPETGCWNWRHALSDKGYGVVRITESGNPRRGDLMLAHRVYYERKHGSINRDIHIHHLCSNSRCVRPDHLQALTPSQHRRLAHGLCREKLTEDDIRDIRRRLSEGDSPHGIIAQYGIDKGTVSRIKHHQIWKDVATHVHSRCALATTSERP